jgi:hypothetical protein
MGAGAVSDAVITQRPMYLSLKTKKNRFVSGCESARPEIHPGQEF